MKVGAREPGGTDRKLGVRAYMVPTGRASSCHPCLTTKYARARHACPLSPVNGGDMGRQAAASVQAGTCDGHPARPCNACVSTPGKGRMQLASLWSCLPVPARSRT